MHAQGIDANIMSLGGIAIAIAIGAMVDAAIVMIENAHKHLEHFRRSRGRAPQGGEHWQVISQAASEVGPALFFSLLIITLSFLTVFALEAQEGRLFTPLAYTKTYAMAAATGLSVTLVPVLMGYFIRGRIPREDTNPLNRLLIRLYRPLLRGVLAAPWVTIGLSVTILSGLLTPLYGVGGHLEMLKWPFQAVGLVQAEGPHQRAVAAIEGWQKGLTQRWREAIRGIPVLEDLDTGLGSEFMPALYEGDLMYMPTTLPGLSIGKARELLQQTDRLIATLPEVARVFGKVGRADTATDPAPLTMIETLIQLKPESEWRPGMTIDKLIAELDRTVAFPSVTNTWVMPIKTRTDMLATGIKTPVGIKVAGPDIREIERIGKDIERVVLGVPGTASAFSERVAGGRYLEIRPDRIEAARVGLNIEDINQVVAAAVGGINITQTVEGRERYPVNLRFPRERRNNLVKLRELPLVTPTGAQIPLGQVAAVEVVAGAPMLKSENARLNGWTFVDIRGLDVGTYVHKAQAAVRDQVRLPPGYSTTWSGQYEYILRAQQRLTQVVPFALVIIFGLLYLTFRRAGEALWSCSPYPSPWSAASGSSICWTTTYRWRWQWASSPWPGSRRSSAS